MTSMEEQSRCFYLDSDYQPASDMLRKCVEIIRVLIGLIAEITR